jgi:REP element-mobilizing transposase RayT
MDGYVYHVSPTTDRRRPVFASHAAARVLMEAIQFQRPDRALVLAYVVMPDHFHLLLQPRESWSLSKIVGSIKGYSSRVLNEMHGVTGRLWQPSFYDRVIRSEH